MWFIGTVWTAAAHAVAAVIGSGVLAVPWSVAQMGWLFGPLALFTFASVTYFTARLLADCYRTPDPVHGSRNYTYIGAVRAYLGISFTGDKVRTQMSLMFHHMSNLTLKNFFGSNIVFNV